MTRNLVRLADMRETAASGEARRLRLAANLSLGEVARELGVSVPTVLRWETGERKPLGKAAFRYAGLLEELAARESGGEA